MYDEEYEWIENDNGNFVAISDGGYLEATVFSKGYAWQIIINGEGVGHIVAHEAFNDSAEAMTRAEAVLNGAECALTLLKPNAGPVTTSWRTQKTVANGSPTYGRKHHGLGVSVKKATSGQWFYVTYSGSTANPVQGWYRSAEEAKQAFDSLHL